MQIGGPAGAFIVIVYGIVERYGVANLLIATAMAGVLLFVMGLTAPRHAGALHPGGDRHRLHQRHRGADRAVAAEGLPRPAHRQDAGRLLRAHRARSPAHIDTVNLPTVALGLSLSLLLLIALGPRRADHGCSAASRAASCAGQPRSCPGPSRGAGRGHAAVAASSTCRWRPSARASAASRAACRRSRCPTFLGDARNLIAPTVTIALLGAIESLLCARVADSMIDDRHDPNQELMAQGIANVVAPFFGGMPATGTIARTVDQRAQRRAHARSPASCTR